MSHFSVLVIGNHNNLHEQLAPYHEFECTGIDDQYVQDIDITSKVMQQLAKSIEEGEEPAVALQSALDYYGLTERTVTDESEVDKEDVHKYGHAIVQHGTLIKAIDRTNPNRKWDWYQVGGRWSGFLKLKPGMMGEVPGLMDSHFAKGPDRVDSALKGDIDFEGMRNDAGEKAGALWDKAHALTGGATWESWESVRTRLQDIDAARAFYNSQPAVVALKEGDRDKFGWFLDDTLSGPREFYVQVARNKALSTYAVVYKGEWSEKGRMGWWGCSDDKMTQEEWNVLVNALIDGLPDDALLTIVDCHI